MDLPKWFESIIYFIVQFKIGFDYFFLNFEEPLDQISQLKLSFLVVLGQDDSGVRI